MSAVTVIDRVTTCGAAPSQWELALSNGRFAHVRYRHGLLSIGIGVTIDEAIDASAPQLPNPPFQNDSECTWEDVEPHVMAAVANET